MQRWTRIFLTKQSVPTGQECFSRVPQALLLSLVRGPDAAGKGKGLSYPGDSRGIYSEQVTEKVDPYFGQTSEASMSDTSAVDFLPMNETHGSSVLSSSVGNAEDEIPTGSINASNKQLNSEMCRLKIDEQMAKNVLNQDMVVATELNLLNLTGSCLLVAARDSDGQFPGSAKQTILTAVPRFGSLRAIKKPVRSYSNFIKRLKMPTEDRGVVSRAHKSSFSSIVGGILNSLFARNPLKIADIVPMAWIVPPNPSRSSEELSVRPIDDKELSNLNLIDFKVDDFTFPEVYRGSLQAAVQDIIDCKGPNSINYIGVHQDLGHIIVGEDDKVLCVVPKHYGDLSCSESTPEGSIGPTLNQNLILASPENRRSSIPVCGSCGALALNMLVDISSQSGSINETLKDIEKRGKSVDKGSTSTTKRSTSGLKMSTIPVVRFGSGELAGSDTLAGQRDPNSEGGVKKENSRKAPSGRTSPGWAAGLKSGLQSHKPPLNVGTTCKSPKSLSEDAAPLGQSVILSHPNMLNEPTGDRNATASSEPTQLDGYPRVPIMCYPQGNRVRRTKSGKIKFPRPCSMPIAPPPPPESTIMLDTENAVSKNIDFQPLRAIADLSFSESPYSPSPPKPPGCEDITGAALSQDSANSIRCCPWPAHLPCPCIPNETPSQITTHENILFNEVERDEPQIDDNAQIDEQEAEPISQQCACLWPCEYPCPDWSNRGETVRPFPIPEWESQQLPKMDNITRAPFSQSYSPAYHPSLSHRHAYPESVHSNVYLRTPSFYTSESAKSVVTNEATGSYQPVSSHRFMAMNGPTESYQPMPSYQSVVMDESHQPLPSYQSVAVDESHQPLPSYKSVAMDESYQPLPSHQSGALNEFYPSLPSYQSVTADELTGSHQPMSSYQSVAMYEPTGSYKPALSCQSVPMDELTGSYYPVASYKSAVMAEPTRSYKPVSPYQSGAMDELTESYKPEPSYQSAAIYQPGGPYQPTSIFQSSISNEPVQSYRSSSLLQSAPAYQSMVTPQHKEFENQLGTSYQSVAAYEPMPSYQSAGCNPEPLPIPTAYKSKKSEMSSCMPWMPCPNWVANPYPIAPKSQKSIHLDGSIVTPMMGDGLDCGLIQENHIKLLNKNGKKPEVSSTRFTVSPGETDRESSRSNELPTAPSEKLIAADLSRNVRGGTIPSDPVEKGPVVAGFVHLLDSSSSKKASESQRTDSSRCNIKKSLQELLPETSVRKREDCDSVSCSQPASSQEHQPIVRFPNRKSVRGATASLYNFRSVEAEMQKLDDQAVPGMQFYEDGLFKMLNELGVVDLNKSAYGGDWVGSGPVVPAIDPAMCSKIVDVVLPTQDELDQCIQAAKDASQVWIEMQPPCRSVVLREIARKIREKRQLLARLVSLEVGKVIMDALCEVRGVIDMFEYAAGLASALPGNIFESERPGHIILERFHPMGMVGIIASFNTPFSTFGKSASMSLAVGNSVVFKPAPTTVLSSIALMKIVTDVFKYFGLPPVVTVIQGDENVGRDMAQDERIELIAFSGRAANGHDVGLRVQNRFGKSILNLHGNNAMIVNHDANLELALNAATLGIVDFAGQKKQKIAHIIVHRHLYDRFVEELIKRIERIRKFCGHPLDPRSIFGPLHTKGIAEAFMKAVQEIRENGGKIETGGNIIRGNFVQPTVVTNIHSRSDLMAFPIVGPIAFVTSASDIEEAIQINNGFSNRVNSSVFTKNVVDVFKYLGPNGLSGGVISVNTANTGTELAVSLGGDRAAGGGRFSGSDIWKEYCRRVAVNINFSSSLPYAHGSGCIFGADKFKLR